MKKLKRPDLSLETLQCLKEAQENHRSLKDPWESFKKKRQGDDYANLRSALESMSGKYQTCMYCEVSEGGHVEHFWPKTKYPQKMFDWDNLLLCCAVCGSEYKGDKFPLCENSLPLLINPADEDPWQYLQLDLETFILTARFFLSEEGQVIESRKGHTTAETFGFAERESLKARFQGNHEDLVQAVNDALRTAAFDEEALIETLKAVDKYCMLGWYLRGTGGDESPFRELKENHPFTWERLKTAIPY